MARKIAQSPPSVVTKSTPPRVSETEITRVATPKLAFGRLLVMSCVDRLGEDAYLARIVSELTVMKSGEVNEGAVFTTLKRLRADKYLTTSRRRVVTDDAKEREVSVYSMTAEGRRAYEQSRKAYATL